MGDLQELWEGEMNRQSKGNFKRVKLFSMVLKWWVYVIIHLP